jgi:hypothetical protein
MSAAAARTMAMARLMLSSDMVGFLSMELALAVGVSVFVSYCTGFRFWWVKGHPRFPVFVQGAGGVCVGVFGLVGVCPLVQVVL